MIFLPIDSKSKNTIKDFEDFTNDKNTHIFVIFYMDKCGPCNQVRPEWAKIKDKLIEKKISKMNDIIIADINQDVLTDELNKKYSINGFPTIKYLKNGNQEDYNGERNIDVFINWIQSKTTQTGGKKTRKRKTKKSKKNRRRRMEI